MAGKQVLIVANWKMNLGRAGAVLLAQELVKGATSFLDRASIVICPPYPYIQAVHFQVCPTPIMVGGQDCHDQASGAYTGNVSATMLADMGCKYALLGHSERRVQHHESTPLIAEKYKQAQSAGLIPIVCVGEKQEERGEIKEILRAQLQLSWGDGPVVVAYEPVWAIGTGLVPSLDDIAMAHGWIAECLLSQGVALENLKILYGGSVNAQNAQEILSVPKVDGLLVGGASLKCDSFVEIVRVAAGL